MIAFNKKYHITGKPCRKCGSELRYKKQPDICVPCQKIRLAEYRRPAKPKVVIEPGIDDIAITLLHRRRAA